FPGRDLYLDVKYITLKDLQQEYGNVVIVDARSSYEFNTLHINGAVNIPLSSRDYKQRMKELRKQNPGKKIITYCNGKTCMKSYKAARKAQRAGVDNIYAFDAGIFDWAKANADKASLLGISPVDPTKLIAKKDFKKKLLNPEDFMNKARESNGLIVDTRDPLQRDGVSMFIGKEKRASLHDEKAINKVIDVAVAQNKPMFIYDEAGKQVRWLMYRLEQRGVKEYYFMKGGTKGYYKGLRTAIGIN
ncbi:MAG: rhodanese-like domain-containing protein, partial [Gammaproteobacteria bacterium]